jgi:hypothetical protein
MGSLVFQATLGGQVNLNGPNTASTFDIAVPATTGTMVTTGDSGTVTNTMLAASAYNTPGTIGSGTANTGAFTTLSASSTVSGTGFSTYLASPPAIGGTTAAAGAFTTLSASSTVSGTGFSTYLASPPAIGGTAAAAGTFTTLSGTTSVTTPIVKSASSLTLQTNGTTTAVTIDTSQNVGIGTTPSAWLSTVKAIQLSNRASIYTDSSGNTIVGNNSFVNSSSQDIYLQTAQASAYLQGAGQHKWYNAPSGTAGNAITFTQAMTLDNSGNLGIGTSSPGYKLDVVGTANINGITTLGRSTNVAVAVDRLSDGFSYGLITFNNAFANATASGIFGRNTGGDAGKIYLISPNEVNFQIAGVTKATLDSSGNFGIGATANASAILDAQSTTKGVRMPNMTTTQKNAIASPAAGLMVFDTTLAKLCVYSGSAWQTITSV